MNGIVDRRHVESALRSAAVDALAELSDVSTGKHDRIIADLAMRFRNELRIATINWATVEAFNNSFEGFRDQLREGGAWQPALFAVRALARDVIMTLFRITDTSGKELETFCSLAQVVTGKAASEISAATGAAEEDVAAGLQFIFDRVPTRWGRSLANLPNTELADLRSSLEPVRNSLIAHAKTYSSLDLRSAVGRTRRLLQLTSELSDAACMVCNVPRDDLQRRWDKAFEEGSHFWDVVESGSAISRDT